MNKIRQLTKRILNLFTFTCFSFILYSCIGNQNNQAYAQIPVQEKGWYKNISEIPVPLSYVREKNDTSSYGYYLQHLPLKTTNNTVYLYDKTPKYNQSAQFAIVKMDVGTQDLQQCADAVMRLRAEYLFNKKKFS